jgi:hypothetical protein
MDIEQMSNAKVQSSKECQSLKLKILIYKEKTFDIKSFGIDLTFGF